MLSTFLVASGVSAQGFGSYGYNRKAWAGIGTEALTTVIVQFPVWLEAQGNIDDIHSLVAAHRKVIIDFEFFRTERQRSGASPVQPVKEVVGKISAILDKLDGVPIAAISLDEESKPSKDRVHYLAEIYNALKARFPREQFFQWIRFVRPMRELSDFHILQMPSDGFIIDPYLMPASQYEELGRALAHTGKPVISVVWASPGWKVGGGRTMQNSSWWNGQEWKTFYQRVAFNQSMGFQTVFFMFSIERTHATPIWKGAACEAAFFNEFSRVTIPYMEKHQLPIKVPDERPKWIPGFCSKQ